LKIYFAKPGTALQKEFHMPVKAKTTKSKSAATSKPVKTAKSAKSATKPAAAKAPAKKAAAAPKSASKPAKPAPVPSAAPAKAAKPAQQTISRDEIALRAYYIGERRQMMGWPGDSSSDWIEAEAQLVAELKRRKS
jgi:hypothetical protein